MARTGNCQIGMVIGQWIRAGLEDFRKKNTIPVLDGVRAFACLIVIWFHVYRIPRDLHVWSTQPFSNRLLNSFLFFGKYGVTLFFVLSGFLLFLPFARRRFFEKLCLSFGNFFVGRFSRVLPPFHLPRLHSSLCFRAHPSHPT